MALHSAVFTAVLLLGSNATVLISTYNIGSEVSNLGLWMGIRSCGMLLLAAITWVGISLLERWQEEEKRLPLLLLWAADIVSCLMAMFLSRGNTASVLASSSVCLWQFWRFSPWPRAFRRTAHGKSSASPCAQ